MVQQDLLVLLVQMDLQEHPVLMEHPVQMGKLVQMVHQVLMDHRDLRDLQVHQVRQVFLV